jgi:enamine deaminase RidA (YjgF/YER057c/UK114 family)
MAHQRIPATDGNTAVRAGRLVFLRGLSGNAPGDAGAQAAEAMRAAEALLRQAGAQMADVRKLTTCITDRAWHGTVRQAVDAHLGTAIPVRTEVIVQGLARPEMLVAIDIDAVLPA